MAIRGSCLCGAVSYEITGSFKVIGHCHCSTCRKSHGAAFGLGEASYHVRRRSQRQMAKCARVLQSPVSPGASAKVRPTHPLHGRAAGGAPLHGSV